MPAADFRISECRDDQGAGDEHDRLDGLGHDHGREPAQNGVQGCEAADQKNAGPFLDAKDPVEDDPAGGKGKGNVEDNAVTTDTTASQSRHSRQ